ILADGPFRAVASFMPRDRVRLHVQECVIAAVSAAAEGLEESVVLRRFLQHSEQRFRLDYLLGTLRLKDDEVGCGPNELDDEGTDNPTTLASLAASGEEEEEKFEAVIRGFLDRVNSLATSLQETVSRDLGVDPANLGSSDRDAFLDLLEHELEDNEE